MATPTDPEKTVILREADISTIPLRSAGLKSVVGFVVTTFRNYWPILVPAEQMAEFSASLEQFNGVPREEKMKQLEQWWDELEAKDPSFDAFVWPQYDRKKLSDCVGRNLLAAMIVQDPEKQAMMGGKYNYCDEVQEVCNMITKQDRS